MGAGTALHVYSSPTPYRPVCHDHFSHRAFTPVHIVLLLFPRFLPLGSSYAFELYAFPLLLQASPMYQTGSGNHARRELYAHSFSLSLSIDCIYFFSIVPFHLDLSRMAASTKLPLVPRPVEKQRENILECSMGDNSRGRLAMPLQCRRLPLV